jgi:uncharacterized protein
MKIRRRHADIFITILAATASACVSVTGQASGSTYRQSVEKWRQDYLASLTSDSGWLTVSGLFWLKEGDNRIGSAKDNNIVLPASAPASVGVITFHAGQTTMHVNPGIPVTLNGLSVQTTQLRPDVPGERLLLGDLTIYVHLSGDRYALRVKDKNAPLRKNFKRLNWFPIDEAYAVTGTYATYESPRELDSQNVLGDAIKLKITGYIDFDLKGQKLRLEAETENEGKTLFIVFRDLTSRKETYPASRFLKLEAPNPGANGGAVDLDFNKAYNPPCAYNPYTTCPLPLPGNRLKISIPAGEKIYKRNHAS